MLRFREAKERAPFTQIGHPHQKTTGSESRSWIHNEVPGVTRWTPIIGAIARRKTGRPRTAEMTKRRATRDVASSSAPSGRSGSSGIPHFGQSPGSRVRISGCIGQV